MLTLVTRAFQLTPIKICESKLDSVFSCQLNLTLKKTNILQKQFKILFLFNAFTFKKTCLNFIFLKETQKNYITMMIDSRKIIS